MMNSKEKRKPLLYIEQPSFQIANWKMQEVYSREKAEKEKLAKQLEELRQEDIKADERKKNGYKGINGGWMKSELPEELKGDLSSVEVHEAIQQFEREQQNEKRFQSTKNQPFSLKRLKSFKEMDTKERLEYLIKFPKQLPPVACVFQTETGSYKGILLNKEEEFIEIKLQNEETEKISIPSLVEVKMIGF
ncbi:CotO family spore coat protein [Bacillus sp. 03113]|uniref:CotO family spore coat protein n=1 Tax=Bacillus sp. 03113 TaxID=2578211 RepID=UPI001143E022|nr:CotO family spore coat protein [Bacillus sp. 03113]